MILEPVKNRRRYPRIFLVGSRELEKLRGLDVLWPNGVKSPVLDISYLGAAMGKPRELDLERGQALNFALVLEDETPIPFEASVVRTDESLVAVEFLPLAPEARIKLNKFLNDKILGLNMRLVDPKHYGRGQEFTYWYHGPNDTNIFVWLSDEEQIRKAIFELDHEVLFWDEGILSIGKSRAELETNTEDYVFSVVHDAARAPLKESNTTLKRVVDILSQARSEYKPLSELYFLLREKVKA